MQISSWYGAKVGTRARPCSHLAFLSAFALLMGCADSRPPFEPQPGSEVSALIVPNEDPGAPQDPNVNLSDSYAVAIVEVQQRDVTYSDSLVLNPADMSVGNIFDISTPPMKYRYEVGYDNGGQQVAAQRATGGDTVDAGIGETDEAVNFSLVGGGTTATNAYGGTVQLLTSDEMSVATEFRSQLGNLNYVPPLVDGFDQALDQTYLTRASGLAQASASAVPADAEIVVLPSLPVGMTLIEIAPGIVESTQDVALPGGRRSKYAQYALVGKSWRLRKLQLQDRIQVNGRSELHETTTIVRSVRVRRNRTRDLLRRASKVVASESDVLAYEAPYHPRPLIEEVPEESPQPPPAPQPVSCVFGGARVNTTGPRIALQHGVLTDACTWGSAYGPNLFQRGANLRALRVSQTASDQPYADQAASLNAQLQATQVGPWVVVGHSNGGIVARKAHALYGSARVSGIVTMDSPNQGATITQYNRQFALSTTAALIGTGALNGAAWAVTKLGANPVLERISNSVLKKYGPGLLFVAGGIAPVFLSGNQNVFLDMQPGANSAGGLNQPGNEQFNITRIALFSESPRSWLSVRVACDFLGKDGNACVRNMRIANRLSWVTAIAGTIAGVAGWAPGFALARGALAMSASATALDKVWKFLVDGGTSGDGIVSSYTQRALPGRQAELRISGDPTHQKVTRSFAAKQLAEQQLRERFGANITGVPLP